MLTVHYSDNTEKRIKGDSTYSLFYLPTTSKLICFLLFL